MDRRQREAQSGRVSARRAAETHQAFERTTLRVPDGVKFFVIDKEEMRKIDILPYRVGQGNPQAQPGELYFERTYWAHRDIGVNGDSFVCPARTIKGRRCPICEAQRKMANDPNADPDAAKALTPKERQLFNVIDLDHPDKGVQIWDISYHLFTKRLYEEIKNSDESDGFEFFADLADGMSLRLGVAARAFNKTKFFEVSSVQFKRRATPYDASILDAVYNLDDALIVKDYDELRAIFLQLPDATSAGVVDAGGAPATVPATRGQPKATRASDDDEWSQPTGKRAPAAPATPPAAPPTAPAATDDDWGAPAPAATVAAAAAPAKAAASAPPAGNGAQCVACEGTGKTSKGNKCPICAGVGATAPAAAAASPAKAAPPTAPPTAPAATVDDDWGDPVPAVAAPPVARAAKPAAPPPSADDDWN